MVIHIEVHWKTVFNELLVLNVRLERLGIDPEADDV